MKQKQREKITKNVGYLLISDVVVRVITGLMTLLVARYVGVAGYGTLSVALGVSAIAGYFTNLGLNHTFIREGTKPNSNIPVLVSTAVRIRLFLALATSVATYILIERIYPDPVIQSVIYFIALPTIWGRALINVGICYFQMKQVMKYSAMINIITGSVAAIVILMGITLDGGLRFIALSYGFSSIVGGLFSIYLVFKQESYVREWSSSIFKGLWAFMLSGFATITLPQLGILILAKVGTIDQVGIFAISYRIPLLLYHIPGVLATAFYPQLFHHGARNLGHQLSLSITQLKAMMLLSVFLTLPLALYSSLIISTVFGAQWESASSILSLLAWLVVFRSIIIPLSDAMTTKGLQVRRASIEVCAVAIGIVLYWKLGLHSGAIGTAVAALIIESFILIFCVILNPTGWRLFSRGISKSLVIVSIGIVIGISLRIVLGETLLSLFLSTLLFSLIIMLMDKDYRLAAKFAINRMRTFI